MNNKQEQTVNNAVNKLAELKFGKKTVELNTDKVGYSLEDAIQLETALVAILDTMKADQPYKESNTMKTIKRHSDQVQEKRLASDVLNECNDLAKQIVTLINKK
jgi:hypothetical protein